MSSLEEIESLLLLVREGMTTFPETTLKLKAIGDTLEAANRRLDRLETRRSPEKPNDTGRWVTATVASIATVAGMITYQFFFGGVACH